MPGIFFIEAIGRSLRRKKLEKKLLLAASWPITQAEINHWQVLPADEELATSGTPYQIEAGFHFRINGEYYGGYLRSVAMTHHLAESKATGSPLVRIRYNPANPDEVAVLVEDNQGNLPFLILPS